MSQEMAKAVDQLFGQDPQDEVSGSVNKGVSFVKSRSEAAGFPKGWYREELVKSGVGVVNPGHKIIHYFSPDGRKFRTKAELARFFGVRLDLSNFDFKSGKIHTAYANASLKKNQQQGKVGAALKSGSAGLGPVTLQKFLDPPARQCIYVLHKKVRSIETCSPNVSCKDVKEGTTRGGAPRSLKPKPVQVFWAKRLEGLVAVDADSDLKLTPQLPRGFKASSSVVSDNAAMISLASALYNAGTPGYTGPDESAPVGQQEKIKSHASAYVQPYQPLIATMKVSAVMIEEQELQVQRLRQDLAKMLSRQQKERG